MATVTIKNTFLHEDEKGNRYIFQKGKEYDLYDEDPDHFIVAYQESKMQTRTSFQRNQIRVRLSYEQQKNLERS